MKASLKEDTVTEFKSSFTEKVIETLVAFANTKRGKVLIGVDDQGKPSKGFTIGMETIQTWINEIKNKTQPSIIPDAEVKIYSGSTIVGLAIKEFPIKPVSFRGRYFKSIEDLKKDAYTSKLRNKLIAVAFYLTKDIVKYGTGFFRVRKEIKQYPTMTFQYQEQVGGFVTELAYTVPKTSTVIPSDTVTDTVTDTVNGIVNKDRLSMILEEIFKNNPLSIDDLAKKSEKVVSIEDVGSLAKYANAPFFKKKDEEAIEFLKKHPIP